MKFRHAAALKLVGWYLLMPPMGKVGGDVLVYAPLPQWAHEGSYDTAAECEEARASSIDEEQKLTLLPGSKEIQALRRQNLTATLAEECIATDDPRLKGN